MTVNYKKYNILYNINSSFKGIIWNTKCKQVKTNIISERNYTQQKVVLALFFVSCIILFTSCRESSEYDFKSSSEAIRAYRDFQHRVHSASKVDAEKLSEFICQWQELSDTVYNFIRKDPAFVAHNTLSMDFGLTTDSIRYELIRLADHCRMKDVAYVKLNTTPYGKDSVFEVSRKKAMTFFSSLDRQSAYHHSSVRHQLHSYAQFLQETKAHGINGQKELMEFIEKEDRHFRAFLNNIDQCSLIGVEDITRITEDICNGIYQSGRKIESEDVMVYMSMRTNRRLLLNARICHDSFKKGDVKSASQANAYLWMMIQPYLSIDSFVVAMLTESQREMMMAIADDYPEIVSALAAKGFTDASISLQIPTQLMRLYISTI